MRRSHQQRDFIRLAENPTKPLLDINYGLAATHKRVFAAFLDALHESRRLQADRTLRQYEHLIAHLKERIPHELNQNPGGQELQAPPLATQPPAPSKMGWLVAVAVTFLMIHMVAGTIWLRASANEAITSEHEAIASSYD